MQPWERDGVIVCCAGNPVAMISRDDRSCCGVETSVSDVSGLVETLVQIEMRCCKCWSIRITILPNEVGGKFRTGREGRVKALSCKSYLTQNDGAGEPTKSEG